MPCPGCIAANKGKAKLAGHTPECRARFEEWLREGPANGMKHLFSRNTADWVPSKCGSQPEASAEQLQRGLAQSSPADTPLGAQHLANVERKDRGLQWASYLPHDILDWPDECEPLPPMTLQIFTVALFYFADGTGIGWDDSCYYDPADQSTAPHPCHIAARSIAAAGSKVRPGDRACGRRICKLQDP